MMAIYAAQRLRRVTAKPVSVFALADEEGARAFIKSVAGIAVGTRLPTGPNQIQFTLADVDTFRKAKAALTRRYGVGKGKHASHVAESVQWNIDPEKIIMIADTPPAQGYTKTPYTITLVDLAHKESISQMLRRLAKQR